MSDIDYMTAPVLTVMTKTDIFDLFPEQIDGPAAVFHWTHERVVVEHAVLFDGDNNHRVIKCYTGRDLATDVRLRLSIGGDS